MRIIFFCIAFFMSVPMLNAQDKIDSYGKIDPADLAMKTCDFDPEANAFCLLDIGEVSYSITRVSVDIVTNFRKRIKILKESGINRANIKIRYYSKDRFEDIDNIFGIVYNLDEAGNLVTTKLEKSLIYDKKIDSRFSEISFALPNVKPGSVIEYKYRSFKKNTIANIDDWYFQSDIPVRYSAYNLIIPNYFDFSYKVIRRQPMDLIKSKNDRDGDWFIMRNIPSLKDEPYMASYRDYLQRVDFQLSGINAPGQMYVSYRTTWEKLTEELMEAEWFGKQVRKNIPGTSGLLKILLANATTVRQKTNIIYKFVQSNMSWNGDYARGSYDGVKDAWDKKSGSTADINLLLLNLLKDNGIDAHPLLVSTRGNGNINALFPFLEQFNAVYVYIEIPGQQPCILNAADKFNPSDIYPYDVQLTQAFVVDKKNGKIIQIDDPQKKLRHVVSVFMAVDEKGGVSGNAMVNSYDYAKNIRRKTYQNNELKKFFEDNEGIKLTIDSVNVKNEDIDSLALEQRLYFTGEVQSSGEYSFLPYNLFSGLGKNPFTAEKRSSAIDFGYNQSYTVSGTYIIPVNYDFDELPKSIRMILPDTSISLSRVIQKTDNVLSYRLSIDFLRPLYEADEYPDVKEVYKKIFAILNEHIVIKKKK